MEVDGLTTPGVGDETDVSSFVKVLRTRGFVLDGEEGDAINLENKMFVKIKFIKAAQPTKGKNANKEREAAARKPKGKKFLEKGDEIDEEKVLKPCVYRLR